MSCDSVVDQVPSMEQNSESQPHSLPSWGNTILTHDDIPMREEMHSRSLIPRPR